MRSIAKDKGLHSYYKLTKADLVALLLQQSSAEMPTPPSRSKDKGGRCAFPIKIIPRPQEMDEFEKDDMKNSRPVVERRLSKLHKWLDDYASKPIKKAVDKAFSREKSSMLRLYDGAKKTLKDMVEKEAVKEY